MLENNARGTSGNNPATNGNRHAFDRDGLQRLSWAFAASVLLHSFALFSYWGIAPGGSADKGTGGTRSTAHDHLNVILVAVERLSSGQTAGDVPGGKDRARNPAGPEDAEPGTAAPGRMRGEAPLPLPVYHPAYRLTKQPRLVEPVDETVPTSIPPGYRGEIRLTLFVNEAGTVDRVLVGNADVPTELAGMISDRFRQARFVPGEIDGVPVKVRFMVLVALAGEDD